MIGRKQIQATQWLDFKCEDQDKVFCAGNKIIAKQVCCLFGYKKITKKGSFLVVPHFINIACVGIKRKNQDADANVNESVQSSILFYHSQNCFGEETVSGFKSGDSVRFSVDLQKEHFRVQVNEKLIIDMKHPLLKNKENWFQFIFLQEREDYLELYQ